ncbi:MAG: hypothetical protein NTZ65_02550 [Candidatus Berkelbacteria bacterium]|nr:hypothetical protein [Candidatus Berkelbacteria bacterium]
MAEQNEAPAAAPVSSGVSGAFPQELNGWNWGAFFLTWIWSIGNSVWIGLLALIGPIGLIMAIVLGIKGNEWAWNKRKFASVEEFRQVQKAWAIWGLVLFVVGIVIAVVVTISSGLLATKAIKDSASTTSEINSLINSAALDTSTSAE